MAYVLDVDPDAQDQIRSLPPEALTALVEAFEVLALVPERGRPLNPDNPRVDCANSPSAACWS